MGGLAEALRPELAGFPDAALAALRRKGRRSHYREPSGWMWFLGGSGTLYAATRLPLTNVTLAVIVLAALAALIGLLHILPHSYSIVPDGWRARSDASCQVLAEHLGWAWDAPPEPRLPTSIGRFAGTVSGLPFVLEPHESARILRFTLPPDCRPEWEPARDFDALPAIAAQEAAWEAAADFPATKALLRRRVALPLGRDRSVRITSDGELWIQTQAYVEKGMTASVQIRRRMREAEAVLALGEAIAADLGAMGSPTEREASSAG